MLRSIAALVAVLALLAGTGAAGVCAGACSLHPCCAKNDCDQPLMRARMACCDAAPARATLPTPVVQRDAPLAALPSAPFTLASARSFALFAPISPTPQSHALYLRHLRLLL